MNALATMRGRLDQMLTDLESLASVETPTEDLDAVRRGVEVVTELGRRLLGREPDVVERGGRPHLRWGPRQPEVLLLGHVDTVWPLGTLARWPFAVDGDVATGPGVFDMKAGIVIGMHALSVLGVPDGVALLLTSDEETGSAASRALIEETARRCRAVLVLEPAAGDAVKVARKGVSTYRLKVTGRAAHAGLEPERGANALVALAGLLLDVVELARPEVGTTVTPTTARAGTTVNTVPAAAEAEIDVRAEDLAEQERVDGAIRGLQPHVAETQLAVHGGINRPPLERARSTDLFARAQTVAERLGLPPVEEAAVGGGSDGNFTAALGVPTLDGLGAVGGGAHAEGEHVRISSLPERAALVAGLVRDLLP